MEWQTLESKLLASSAYDTRNGVFYLLPQKELNAR
jgi:hypothetical protein